MRVLGIDEAGRGCVLGSMFLCGFACDTSDYTFLEKIGVRDSKLFFSQKAQEKRIQIAKILKEKFSYKIIECKPYEIDQFVVKNQLNLLERKSAIRIIQSFQGIDKIYLDGKNIFSKLEVKYSQAVAMNKGDSKNLAIAAASILAKSIRDSALEVIYAPYQLIYGEKIKGKGYANYGSSKFVCWYLKKYKKKPHFLRKSYQWKV